MSIVLTALQALTDDVALYISGRLRYNLRNEGPNDFPPRELGEDLVAACEQVISVITEAWMAIPIQVDWELDDFVRELGTRPSGKPGRLEDELLKKFPPAYPRDKEVLEGRPGRVLDSRGTTLAWYLPEAISQTVQNRLIFSLAHLRSYMNAAPPSSGTGWRNDPSYFREPGKSELPPGVVNLSPLWGQVGHEWDGTPLQNSSLLTDKSGGARRFLREIVDFQALIGGIISVLHPPQYCIMRAALVRAVNPIKTDPAGNPIPDTHPIRDVEGLRNLLRFWGSGFTGLSVISQRESPLHRDGQSPSGMFDILATIGRTIDPDIRAELPGIGIRFQYNPGTLLAVLSKSLRHGVSVSAVERYCFAFFTRERVLHQLGYEQDPRMSDELFLKWLGAEEHEKVERFIHLEKGGKWEYMM